MARKLHAEDGDCTFSKLNPNDYISNGNGQFSIYMTGWHDSTLSSSSRLSSSLLFARLVGGNRPLGEERFINLTLFIENEDGKFAFKKPEVNQIYYPVPRRLILVKLRIHFDVLASLSARRHKAMWFVYYPLIGCSNTLKSI